MHFNSSCKICAELKRCGTSTFAFITLNPPDPFKSIGSCGGLCVVFLDGIKQQVSVQDQQRTATIQIETKDRTTGRRIFNVSGTSNRQEIVWFLSFFTDFQSKELPWSIFPQRPHHPRSSVRDNLQQLSTWLEDCSTGHEQCRPRRSSPPSRVRMLHLKGSSAFLVEDMGLDTQFAALSHCWGGEQPVMTTKASLQDHKNGISLEALPKSFQEAVQLCVFLRIGYLWIDSLCIVQDDPADWELESQKMGSVYQYAYLVIAADSGTSSQQGFLGERNDPTKLFTVPATIVNEELNLFVRDRIFHTLSQKNSLVDSSREPLERRGWALQEWLLACRVIHFSRREMIWDCRSASHCECGELNSVSGEDLSSPDSKFYQGDTLRNNISAILTIPTEIDIWGTFLGSVGWMHTIEEFTSRQLTINSDRMIAVSGLASALAEAHPEMGRYCCGFFGDKVNTQLLWQRVSKLSPNENIRALAKPRPAKVQSPTWSWGSLEGPVSWKMAESTENHKFRAYNWCSIEMEADESSQWGQTVSGVLRLFGQALRRRVLFTNPQSSSVGMTCIDPELGKNFDINHGFEFDTSDVLGLAEVDVVFMRILSLAPRGSKVCSSAFYLGLVASNSDPDFYERFGCGQSSRLDPLFNTHGPFIQVRVK